MRKHTRFWLVLTKHHPYLYRTEKAAKACHPEKELKVVMIEPCDCGLGYKFCKGKCAIE